MYTVITHYYYFFGGFHKGPSSPLKKVNVNHTFFHIFERGISTPVRSMMKNLPIHKVGENNFHCLLWILCSNGVQTTTSDLGLSEFRPLSHQGFQGKVLPSVLIFLWSFPKGISEPFSVKNLGVPFETMVAPLLMQDMEDISFDEFSDYEENDYLWWNKNN